MESSGSDFSKLKKVKTWLKDQEVFTSIASFGWFVHKHRRELVEAGALIPRMGASGNLVHVDRIGPVVEKILRAESLKQIESIAA